MSFPHVDDRIGTIAAVIGERKGDDSREIGLEGQDAQIAP